MVESEISVHDAHALDGALLLDVREINEWAAGHIPGAVHVPMSSLRADHDVLADRSRTIVCVCRSGNRSRMVTDALLDGGWHATNMVGGMKAWAAAGFPVVDSFDNAGIVI